MTNTYTLIIDSDVDEDTMDEIVLAEVEKLNDKVSSWALHHSLELRRELDTHMCIMAQLGEKED